MVAVVIRIRDDDDPFGAVLAGVPDLVTDVRITEGLRSAEGGVWVFLLGLVGHHQDDLVFDFNPGVIIVTQLGCRDPIAGKYHLAADCTLVGEAERVEGDARRVGLYLIRDFEL